MSREIDRMDPYTGQVDGKTPGQPYDMQWHMQYFDIRDCGRRTIRFKRNIFTGSTFVFAMAQKGNRWNEPGYGWGRWEKVKPSDERS